MLGIVLIAVQFIGAQCHGYMSDPASRNYQHNSEHCPHCLSAGGPGVTYAGGRRWPHSTHGVCGDPVNKPKHHEAGGKHATPPKIARVYSQGQTIAIRIRVTAPHGGRFSFGICPVPRGASAAKERAAVTQRCFDAHRMINARDGTPYWWLGDRAQGDYTMRFKLPRNVVCRRCTLQWHWETANSCSIPGQSKPSTMVPCAKSNAMEEFWNCADVSVVAKRPFTR